MHGLLFTLFDIPFPSYFVMLVTGFVVATAIGALWARRLGHDPDTVVDLGIAMLIAGVVGARLAHVIFDGYFWDYVHLCTNPSQVAWHIPRSQCLAPVEGDWLFGGSEGPLGIWDQAAGVCHPAGRDCWAWARFMNGGLTYYGGFVGASLVAYWQLRRDRFPFWRAADMGGIVVPLGIGFGRMGCVLAGCCFGKPLNEPWALVFPAHSPAADKQLELGLLHSPTQASLPVHPTQLYESAGSFAIAAILMLWLHQRKRYDGHVFLAFVVAYASLRFVLEFFRSDDRGGIWDLSTSQWIGVLLVIAAALAHRRLASGPSRTGSSTAA